MPSPTPPALAQPTKPPIGHSAPAPKQSTSADSTRTDMFLAHILKNNDHKCQGCKIKLDAPTNSGTQPHPGALAHIKLEDEAMKSRHTAYSTYCPCCILDKDAGALIKALANRSVMVFRWSEPELGVPKHADMVKGVRAAYAMLDAHRAKTPGTAHPHHVLPILKGLEAEGYKLSPIWDAPTFVREPLQAVRNDLRMNNLPNPGSKLNLHRLEPNQDVWLSDSWAKIVEARPALWVSLRNELLLLPLPCLATSPHYTHEDAMKAVSGSLKQNEARRAFYGDSLAFEPALMA